jgi:hypothetical protein
MTSPIANRRKFLEQANAFVKGSAGIPSLIKALEDVLKDELCSENVEVRIFATAPREMAFTSKE